MWGQGKNEEAGNTAPPPVVVPGGWLAKLTTLGKSAKSLAGAAKGYLQEGAKAAVTAAKDMLKDSPQEMLAKLGIELFQEGNKIICKRGEIWSLLELNKEPSLCSILEEEFEKQGKSFTKDELDIVLDSIMKALQTREKAIKSEISELEELLLKYNESSDVVFGEKFNVEPANLRYQQAQTRRHLFALFDSYTASVEEPNPKITANKVLKEVFVHDELLDYGEVLKMGLYIMEHGETGENTIVKLYEKLIPTKDMICVDVADKKVIDKQKLPQVRRVLEIVEGLFLSTLSDNDPRKIAAKILKEILCKDKLWDYTNIENTVETCLYIVSNGEDEKNSIEKLHAEFLRFLGPSKATEKDSEQYYILWQIFEACYIQHKPKQRAINDSPGALCNVTSPAAEPVKSSDVVDTKGSSKEDKPQKKEEEKVDEVAQDLSPNAVQEGGGSYILRTEILGTVIPGEEDEGEGASVLKEEAQVAPLLAEQQQIADGIAATGDATQSAENGAEAFDGQDVIIQPNTFLVRDVCSDSLLAVVPYEPRFSQFGKQDTVVAVKLMVDVPDVQTEAKTSIEFGRENAIKPPQQAQQVERESKMAMVLYNLMFDPSRMSENIVPATQVETRQGLAEAPVQQNIDATGIAVKPSVALPGVQKVGEVSMPRELWLEDEIKRAQQAEQQAKQASKMAMVQYDSTLDPSRMFDPSSVPNSVEKATEPALLKTMVSAKAAKKESEIGSDVSASSSSEERFAEPSSPTAASQPVMVTEDKPKDAPTKEDDKAPIEVVQGTVGISAQQDLDSKQQEVVSQKKAPGIPVMAQLVEQYMQNTGMWEVKDDEKKRKEWEPTPQWSEGLQEEASPKALKVLFEIKEKLRIHSEDLDGYRNQLADEGFDRFLMLLKLLDTLALETSKESSRKPEFKGGSGGQEQSVAELSEKAEKFAKWFVERIKSEDDEQDFSNPNKLTNVQLLLEILQGYSAKKKNGFVRINLMNSKHWCPCLDGKVWEATEQLWSAVGKFKDVDTNVNELSQKTKATIKTAEAKSALSEIYMHVVDLDNKLKDCATATLWLELRKVILFIRVSIEKFFGMKSLENKVTKLEAEQKQLKAEIKQRKDNCVLKKEFCFMKGRIESWKALEAHKAAGKTSNKQYQLTMVEVVDEAPSNKP